MNKIYRFSFKGISVDGRHIKSFVIAANKTYAKTQLQARGISVLRIQREFELLPIKKWTLSNASILDWAEQLKLLLMTGMSLADSIIFLQKQLNCPTLQSFNYFLGAAIQHGSNFSDACRHNPVQPPTMVYMFIYIAEISGQIDQSLNSMTVWLKQKKEMRAMLFKTIRYPCFLLVSLVAILVLFICVILPEFATLFDLFGNDLPTLTQILIDTSTSIQHALLPFGAMMTLSSGLVYTYCRHHLSARKKAEILLFHIPTVGPLLKQTQWILHLQAMKLMLSAGLPLFNAIKHIIELSPFYSLRENWLKIYQCIEQGQLFSEALRLSGISTNDVIFQWIRMGEQSGQLEQALSHIITELERRNDTLITKIRAYLGNGLLLIFGAVVGLVMAAMYLPIFHLGLQLG